MPTAKTENYSAADAVKIRETYVNCGTDITETAHNKRAECVKKLAAEFKKSERSIRSKLVVEKVYIARSKVSGVTGDTPEKKDVIAARLVAAVGEREIGGKMYSLNADSMAKANKTDIAFLLHIFNSQIVEESEESPTVETETAEA